MGDWESLFNKKGKVFHEPQEDMNNVIKYMKKEGVKRVLDLGCGSGRHVVQLSKEGFEVIGTDVSKHGLEITRKWLNEKKLNAKLIEASCYEKFPFKDDYFDAVISVQVIHHNYHKQIKYAISEIERVLKPEGIVFITVSASRFKRGATKFTIPEPRVYVPLDGEEIGLPHLIYTKGLLKQDFKNFEIFNLYMDTGKHYCIFGKHKSKASD
jgi:SAM-dependent methyltransferase